MLSRSGRAATALLAVAMLTMSAQTAKAGSKLYAKISTSDNTTMTLVCADAAPSEAGYTFTEFNGAGSWNSSFRGTITSVTVDASCSNYDGTTLANLFYYCDKLTTITNLDKLKTDNVTDMSDMFNSCAKLESIDIAEFSTSNVENFSGMFSSCNKLTALNLSNFNTQNATNMNAMFADCQNLTTLNLSSFNTTNVTNMGKMFVGCENLSSLTFGSNFSTAAVTNMEFMFSGCKNLTTLDLRNFNTENVTDMGDMFSSCNNLESITGIAEFSTSNVEDFSLIFESCKKLAALDLSKWDTQNATTLWGMFSYCKALTTLNLSSFNTKKVTEMADMFDGCENLSSLTFGNTFNTAAVTDMTGMFAYCKALTTLNLSSFNTEKVTIMNSMFSGCENLSSLDLSNWDTQNVATMGYMFSGCTSLTMLDLRSFNTEKVELMVETFKNCANLTTIWVSKNWTNAAVTYGSDTFSGCTKLVGDNGTAYNETCVSADYALVDGNGGPGYLTAATRTLTAGGPDGDGKYWSTFFNSAVGYKISGGEAFAGEYNTTTQTVTLTSLGTNIPANTPVIICADAASVTMTVDNTLAAYTGTNNLHGTDTQTATPANSYCLAIGGSSNGELNGKAGFFGYTGTNIPARRAYLTISGGAALARGFIGFGGDDENTTGIALPEASHDGEDGEVFDLNGRRISGQPQKGIYLKNGKKFVIK